MYAFTIIGMTGQGKSDFTKQLIKGKPAHIFDINNEYYFPRINQDTKGAPARIIFSEAEAKLITRHTELDDIKFINECMKKQSTQCVFEDATGFFEGKVPKILKRMIAGKRHTKNNYLFLFHSIQDCPPALIRLSNYVVLFKTNDEFNKVEQRYEKLVQPYLKLRNAPNYSKLIIKLIDQ